MFAIRPNFFVSLRVGEGGGADGGGLEVLIDEMDAEGGGLGLRKGGNCYQGNYKRKDERFFSFCGGFG